MTATPPDRPEGPRSRLGELIARRRFPVPEEDVKALDRLITATRGEVDQLTPTVDRTGGRAAGAAEASRRWPPADK